MQAWGSTKEGRMGRGDQITMVREALTSVELEIDSAEQEFRRSVAELRGQREKLRKDYAELLKAELVRVDGAGGRASTAGALGADRAMPESDTILAVLKAAAPGGLTTARIRELAGIPRTVPFKSMSRLMKQLVDDGRVVREGRSRGTRYKVR
jgi:hypothetical protein